MSAQLPLSQPQPQPQQLLPQQLLPHQLPPHQQHLQPPFDIENDAIKIPHEDAVALRRQVAALLGRQALTFPGAQPVSFVPEHLKELLSRDYYVCEKSDGTRYLLYLSAAADGSEEAFLIDRKNDYWYVKNKSLHFPLPDDVQAFHTRTILDGELVTDRLDGGALEARFLVFDCLALDGETLASKPLDKRLGRVAEYLYKPYKDLFAKFPDERQYQPFFLKLKNMQLGYGIEAVLHEIKTGLQHGNDGLIFTCRTTPYQFGTDEHILKWKPPEENTVDFRLRLTYPAALPVAASTAAAALPDYTSPRHEIWEYIGGGSGPNAYRKFGDVHFDPDEWDAVASLGDPLDNRIIECYVKDGRWRVARFRDDKPEANHHSVVEKVLASIRNPVHESDLLALAGRIKENWKTRARNPGGPAGV